MDFYSLPNLPEEGFSESPRNFKLEGSKVPLPLSMVLRQMLSKSIALVPPLNAAGVQFRSNIARVSTFPCVDCSKSWSVLSRADQASTSI